MFIPDTEILANRLRLYARRIRAERIQASAKARPFSKGVQRRLLLVSQPERIPQSQIYPFHHYAPDLLRLHGAEVREVDTWDVLAGGSQRAVGATSVAFQMPFDMADADLFRLIDRLRADNPGARLACLDWFAPTDLRNAARLDGWVDVYVKKHVLKDRSRYGQPTCGDTNLTDFYNRRFGFLEPDQCFAVPEGFLNKLLVGPSFATAPGILPSLLGSFPAAGPRPVDIHARFAVSGTPWYQGMRGEAMAALNSPYGLTVVRGDGVTLPRFIAEMKRSKLVFSPFGYGEVCWRDYEAVMTGAVLLKPDMGHVQTDPDIFVPWETYVPVAWDLSDFEATVRRVVGDEGLRSRIARQAFDLLHGWLKSDQFARSMSPLFA
jgi:hypothetical protein